MDTKQTAPATILEDETSALLEVDDDVDKTSRPPTANELANITMQVIRGVVKGKVAPSAADAVSRGISNMVRMQGTKLNAAKFMAKPLHKDLLHELSVKLVK